MNESDSLNNADSKQSERIKKLEEELNNLAGGDAIFRPPPNCPADVWESHLEDILEFESVGSKISLFEGLQLRGLDLPPPEQMDERQSLKKVIEVLYALEDLQIFLIGFQEMTPRDFYSTLYNRTLWEGCYTKKRNPNAITLIDVSHKMPRSELLHYFENRVKRHSLN